MSKTMRPKGFMGIRLLVLQIQSPFGEKGTLSRASMDEKLDLHQNSVSRKNIIMKVKSAN